jgi:hypothetical protein
VGLLSYFFFGRNDTKIEALFQKNGNVGNINSFVEAL